MDWRSALNYDPLPGLLATSNEAVAFHAKDLANNTQTDPKPLWLLHDAQKISSHQQTDGSWKYPSGKSRVRSQENYDQLETFRNLGYLVEMFGCDHRHPAVNRAADFLFGFQTADGDIRGILGNQHSPYYTAAMIELLVKAGHDKDPRTERTFEWLRSMRQNDGGWAIPFRTQNKNLDIISNDSPTLEPDRTKPFSSLITGIVLRAYAAHPAHCHSREAKEAGKLLLSRFFKRDSYPDRQGPEYWLRFTFPFWFTDLLSATDSLSRLGFTRDEPAIENAIRWFAGQQRPNGLWELKTLKNERRWDTDRWISLSICRVLKRLHDRAPV